MVVVAIYPFNSAGSFVQRVVFSLTKLLSSRYPRDRCNHTWRLGENSRDRCNDAWPLRENAWNRCNDTWPLGENTRDRCNDTMTLSKKSLHLNAPYAPRSKTYTATCFCFFEPAHPMKQTRRMIKCHATYIFYDFVCASLWAL